MNVIDELVISLGLDGSKAQKGMQDVKSTISNGISDLTGKLQGFASAFAAAFAVGSAFKAYTAEADAIGKLADAMDVNIESLYAWGEAAVHAGGSSEAFQASLQALNGQLTRTALTGQSRAKMVLEGAGIDAGELGRARDAFAVMEDLAAKAEEMSKAEFLGLGRSLGLDTGTIMLLQQGRSAVKDAIQAQRELGVYTKEDARVTADFNDRIVDSAQAFKTLMAVVFREILPAFTAIVRGFNLIVSTIRKHDVFVKAFFVGLATIITTLVVPAFASLAAAIIANPITWVIAALVALAAVVEDLVVWAQGGESAFADFWEAIFGDPENAIEAFDELIKSIKGIWEELNEFVLPLVKEISQAFSESFDTISEPIQALLSNLAELGENSLPLIKDALGLVGKAIGENIKMMVKFSAESIKAIGKFIGMVIQAAADIVSHIGGAISTVASMWGKLTGKQIDIPVPTISAGEVARGGVSGATNNIDSDTNIGNINVYTQATDAQGISRDIGGAVNDNVGGYWAAQADGGVIP